MRLVLAVLFLAVSFSASWADDAAFVAGIKQDIQDSPELTDYERVSRIRNWVYERVPIGFEGAELPVTHTKTGAVEMLDRIARGEGGYLCGGTGVILRSVYEMFGYRAFTYQMGDGDAGHVVTMVEIVHRGKKVLSIQDAFFGYAVETVDGEPMDANELLDHLETRTAGDVVFRIDIPACKPMMTSADQLPNTGKRISYMGGAKVRSVAGAPTYCGSFNLWRYYAKPRYDAFLKSKTGTESFAWMFAFPHGEQNDPSMKALYARAQKIGASVHN